ncbi:hypothetical protein L3C95_12370, partial [Chitinophaga filiformis]|uniref:hypothetical protein n=1 Tax=Chitinophaga filiformis TaxID=104663 RepID=UPI001F3CAD2C
DDRKESRKLRMESCPARATLEAKGYQGALNDILKEGKKQGDRLKARRLYQSDGHSKALLKLFMFNEPPYAERHVRWCERTVGEVIPYFLLD